MIELVILVNDQNEEIGTASKDSVHSVNTPLHRAFSVFIFNKNKQLLLQQRSSAKKTFPLLWSNSCCGHLSPGETVVAAANRRLWEELKIKPLNLKIVLPDFRYKTSLNGIMENEICPVLIGFYNGDADINFSEIEEIEWIYWSDFMKRVISDDQSLSYWAKEEAKKLDNNKEFLRLVLDK